MLHPQSLGCFSDRLPGIVDHQNWFHQFLKGLLLSINLKNLRGRIHPTTKIDIEYIYIIIYIYIIYVCVYIPIFQLLDYFLIGDDPTPNFKWCWMVVVVLPFFVTGQTRSAGRSVALHPHTSFIFYIFISRNTHNIYIYIYTHVYIYVYIYMYTIQLWHGKQLYYLVQ